MNTKSKQWYLINLSLCWYETLKHDPEPWLWWPTLDRLLARTGN